MNYLGEIKMFYRWIQTRDVRPSTIAMWHGLMYIGLLEQWKSPMEVSVTKLVRYTNLPHTTLYRERDYLCDAGLLKVESKGSNRSSLYTLVSLEMLMSASHGGTHIDLSDTQEAAFGEDASRTCTRGVSITKTSKSIYDMKEKETDKKKKRIEWRDWLEANAQEPWKSVLRLWLEYKEERGEQYSGVVSLGRLLSHLRNISCDNPAVAQQVVDRSIACNWKGLFPLDRAFTAPASSSTPQSGQHIGQIMQPRSESERSSVLDKFNSKITNKKQ